MAILAFVWTGVVLAFLVALIGAYLLVTARRSAWHRAQELLLVDPEPGLGYLSLS